MIYVILGMILGMLIFLIEKVISLENELSIIEDMLLHSKSIEDWKERVKDL